MKKYILTLAAAIMALAASATEPNIFASHLSATPSANATYNVSYVLNAAATQVKMQVLNGSAVVKEIELTGLSKGQNNVTADLSGLDGSYTWQIVATGAANNDGAWVANPTDVTDLHLWSKGVYVENDMTSPAFGNVLLAVPGTAPASQGIVAFDASLTKLGVYTGGITWSGNGGPMRFGVSGVKGKVLLTDWSDSANLGVWTIDPADLTKPFVSVFGGALDGTLRKADGTGICGSVSGACGIERDGHIDLYTCDEDISGESKSYVITLYSGVDYSTPWTAAPTSIIGNWEKQLVNANAGLWPDGRGGMWICQNRWSNSASYPSIMHLNAQNERDYVCTASSIVGGSTAGAMGLNADGSVLACAANTGVIDICSVSWEDGVPALAQTKTITSPIGDSSTQIAFDLAGNLYVSAYKSDKTSANNGMAVYAMPKADNTFTTVAPAALSISASGIEAVGDDASATVTGRYNIAGQPVSADAQGVQIVRYSDGSARKVIVK